jgi:hypothetical protein
MEDGLGLRLFRGIAVAAADALLVMRKIKTEGLRHADGGWRVPYPFVSDEIEAEESSLGAVDREQQMAVCACGDEDGAANYAWVRNRSRERDAPIIIELDVKESDVAVDGKDMLYTVLSSGDPERARPIIRTVYGNAILPYAERAWREPDQRRRVAICDRAVLDPEVVAAHHANAMVIGGRVGTVFRSAFMIKLPVAQTAIVRVWSPSERPEVAVPEFVFSDLLLPRT